MSSNDFSPGLAGVVAFETEIAEPDKEGGELRYRGVNIEDLVGNVPFEQVWGLLVDESLQPGLPYEHVELERRTGGYISDLQSSLASYSGEWQLGKFIDIDDEQAKEDLRRLSAAALSIVAQSARGADLPPVPKATVAEGQSAAERFVLEWRGELDEKSAKAIDTYWICTAEHGLNASTFTARIVASTGADAGAALAAAVGALSGPLHGGANEQVMRMLKRIERPERVESYLQEALARKEKIMGFGHRVYRTEDPRATHLRQLSKQQGEVAGQPQWWEMSRQIEESLRQSKGLLTNVDFYSASTYYTMGIPVDLYTPIFACSRISGWTAHVLEQLGNNRLIRPRAEYTGPTDCAYKPIDQR
jgi:citrate synthase